MELLRKITVTFIIALLYLKFIALIVFQYEGPELMFMDIMTYVMCLLSIDYRRVDFKIFIVVGFLAIAVISPTARALALLVMTLYAMKDCEFRYVAKVNIVLSVLVFIFMALALQTGVLKDDVMYALLTKEERYDFGFGNPNTFALFAFGAMSNFYIVMGKNYRVFTIVVLALLSVPVFLHSGSRTFVAVMFVVLSYSLFQNRQQIKSSRHKLIRLLPLGLMLFTLIGAFLVNVFPLLNALFSFRLTLYNTLVMGTSPFQYLVGNPLVDEMTIDSSYMHLLFRAGIGAFALFYYIFYKTVTYLSEENRYLLPLIVGSMLYAFTESYLTYVLIYSNMILWLFFFQNGFKKKVFTSEISNHSKL